VTTFSEYTADAIYLLPGWFKGFKTEN
jgi:hypothetical protein